MRDFVNYFFPKGLGSLVIFIFLFGLFIFNATPKKVEAGPYFSNIMSQLQPSNDGNTNNFGGMFSGFGKVLTPISNLFNFGKDPFATHSTNQNVLVIKRNNKPKNNPNTNTNNPYISSDVNPYLSDSSNSSSTDATTTATTTQTQTQSLLTNILQRLGIIGNTNTNSSTTAQSASSNGLSNNGSGICSQISNGSFGCSNGPGQNNNMFKPLTPNSPNPYANSNSNNNNFPAGGGVQQRYEAGNPLGSQPPPRLSTPYNGPGGTIPGDCGMPMGPVAYNISSTDGSGVACNAKSVAVGYMGRFRSGIFGIGYINAMTEKEHPKNGSSAGNCVDRSTADEYGEGCFRNYGAGSDGAAHLQEQLLHWQHQGQALGQQCVAVDIDNCDSIGGANYKLILDQVEQLNNQGSVKIKVINKNPLLADCNFMSHPAVMGAMTEVESGDPIGIAKKVMSIRSKPEQILIFGAPKDSENKLRAIANDKSLTNTTATFSSGGSEYGHVYDCTYNP